MNARMWAAVLVLSNIAVAGITAVYVQASPRIEADHVESARFDFAETGSLYVRLGVSSTPSGRVVADARHTGEIVLTPRAAIQLHATLQKAIRDVNEAAEAVRQTESSI